MFRLFVNSGFTLPFPPPFIFSLCLFWHWKREGDSVLIRAASSLMEGELSIAARAQCRRVQAREAEIFGRLTTSVVCRGIWGRELGGHVIIGGYIFAKTALGIQETLLSLSQRIFCQSKCLKFFFSEPPRAVSCRHGNYILPFLPCHFSVPMPWKTSFSRAYLHPLSGFLCHNFFFFLPQFCAQDCVFRSNIYSAFPSLFNIFGNLQSMIWIAGCIN